MLEPLNDSEIPDDDSDLHTRSMVLAMPALSHTFETSSELEKENQHFKVSEALIQAIEESRNADLFVTSRRKGDTITYDLNAEDARADNSNTSCCDDSVTNDDVSDRTSSLEALADELRPEVESITSAMANKDPDCSLSFEPQRKNTTASVHGDYFADQRHSLDESFASDAETTAMSFIRSLPQNQRPIRDLSSPRITIDPSPFIPSNTSDLGDPLPTPVVQFRELGKTTDGGGWVDVDYTEPKPGQIMMRGNEEWAPPRRQIIYHLHPNIGKTEVLAKQNQRCAGCGLIVDGNYIKRFKYCNYLGKYFCHSCHSNSMCIIPARVLWKWEFKKYPVSNFARELLVSIRDDPVFDLTAVDQGALYNKTTLRKAKEAREQLQSFKSYLRVCRSGLDTLEIIDNPSHLTSDPDIYTLAELEAVKAGTYVPKLQHLVAQCFKHVRNCPLCLAKGFFCEACDSKDVIFPFDSNVTKCPQCNTVYHTRCWEKIKWMCPKCSRIERYRLKRI
eukprot:m.139440 g.139440  ORF g.139440 m.139440 type:complete len:505 (-) comp14799_c0_seq1:131-1645(-)